mgnify:CR=1 FL=1
MMEPGKRKRLEHQGWRIGSAGDFLGLTTEERAYVEMRYRLSRALHERRRVLGMTQAEAASKLGSSQSRIAKMEAADPTVSLDLLVKSLLALGATRRMIQKAL